VERELIPMAKALNLAFLAWSPLASGCQSQCPTGTVAEVARHGSGRLFLQRAWREALEHFAHSLIQILDVLVRVAGERIACGAPPDQLLGLGIEEIDNQRSYLIGLGRHQLRVDNG
jgi:aryl-alcohol dehydrogenase-like predicted oxidoreductase